MRVYGVRPCRHCGNPVSGVHEASDLSMCCSRDKCIKIDDAGKFTNKTKPKKILTDKKFKHQLYLDSRGY